MKLTLQFDEDGDAWIRKEGEKHSIQWEHPTQLANILLGKDLDETVIIDIDTEIKWTSTGGVVQLADT